MARYISSYGPDRLQSVVFASSVMPYMLQTGDNPDGALTKKYIAQLTTNFLKDREAVDEQQMTEFFSVNGVLKVDETIRQEALALTRQASKEALMATMAAWATTDFRDDLSKVSMPALIIHGAGDASVPCDGSARRTHEAIPGSKLHLIPDAPHGCQASHPEQFNEGLLGFLSECA